MQLKGNAAPLDVGSNPELFQATEIEIIEFTGGPAPTATVREINENLDAFIGQTVTLRGDLTFQFDSDDFVFNDGTGKILAEVESNPPLNRTMFLTGHVKNGGCTFVVDVQRCFPAEIDASSAAHIDVMQFSERVFNEALFWRLFAQQGLRVTIQER